MYSSATQKVNNPLVTVICPTIRPANEQLVIDIFLSQDYPNKELVIIRGEDSTGNKRNRGVADAQGEIIVHMDDDDYYAPDYISKSVNFLMANNLDLTGLDSAYFYNKAANKAYKWAYAGDKKSMPYVCEATMCYFKKVWQRRRFKDTFIGEGLGFLAHLPNMKAHKYNKSFVAMLHGGNTSSHNAVNTFKEVESSIVLNMLAL